MNVPYFYFHYHSARFFSSSIFELNSFERKIQDKRMSHTTIVKGEGDMYSLKEKHIKASSTFADLMT